MKPKTALITLGILVVALGGWALPEMARESEVKQNALALFAAVEMYSVNHYFEEYPFEPQQLIVEKCLGQLPINPYTGDPVTQVAAGRGQPGDFTYFTVAEEILPGYQIGTRSIYIAYGKWNPLRHLLSFDDSTHKALKRVKQQYPELSIVDERYVISVLEDGDGKPSDYFLRHKKADEILRLKK